MKLPASPRRGFLGSIAAAFGFSLLSPANAATAPNPDNTTATPKPTAAPRKHKQVFDGTSPDNAYPLSGPWIFLNTYNELGSNDDQLDALVVLRHDAICLSMENRLWAKYSFGEHFKVTDKAAAAPSLRNIFWNPMPGDLRSPDMAIDRLQLRGVKFCVCAVAIGRISGIIARQMKLDEKEVKKDWLAGVLPGIEIVPAGVWALNQAQENGMTYCYAS